MTRLLLARSLPQAASGRPAVLRDQLLPTGASGATAGPARRRLRGGSSATAARAGPGPRTLTGPGPGGGP